MIPPLFPRKGATNSPTPRPLFPSHPPPSEGLQNFPLDNPQRTINPLPGGTQNIPCEGPPYFTISEPQHNIINCHHEGPQNIPREGPPVSEPQNTINPPQPQHFPFNEPQTSFNPPHQRENFNEPHPLREGSQRENFKDPQPVFRPPHEGPQRDNLPTKDPQFERHHDLQASANQSNWWDGRGDRNFSPDPPENRYSQPRERWRGFSPTPQQHRDESSYREGPPPAGTFEQEQQHSFHKVEQSHFCDEHKDGSLETHDCRFQPLHEHNFRPRSPEFQPRSPDFRQGPPDFQPRSPDFRQGPPDFQPCSPDFRPPFQPHPDSNRRGPRDIEFEENQFYRQEDNFDHLREHNNRSVSPTRSFSDDGPPTHTFERGSPRFDEGPPSLDCDRPLFNRHPDFTNERRPPHFDEGPDFNRPHQFDPHHPEFRPPTDPYFEGPRFHKGDDYFRGTPPHVYHNDEVVDNFRCPPQNPQAQWARDPNEGGIRQSTHNPRGPEFHRMNPEPLHKVPLLPTPAPIPCKSIFFC